MSAPPLSIIILTIISFLIAIPMMVLSMINIKMSSVWSNSTVAALDLFYDMVFLIMVIIHRKDFSSAFEHRTEEVDNKSFDYVDTPPLKPPSIAFNKWNIISLILLLAANFVALGVVVDDTTLFGGLPVELFGLQKWNFKIQLAQTIILGFQLLTIATTLGISALGRRRIFLEEDNRLQEAQYEF
jgi:hypothetical protein